MSDAWGTIFGVFILGGWILIPILYYIISERIYFYRAKKRITKLNFIAVSIPSDKINHFISFYSNKAKDIEARLNRVSMLDDIVPKGTDSSFWEAIVVNKKYSSAEQIIEQYHSHNKYSHQKQLEQKLKRLFVPD